MELKNAVITDIVGVCTVYSPKGRAVKMKNRESYGLSLCIDGQITYTHRGRDYVSDKDHAVILPKGQDYSLKGDKTGSFPVINFQCGELLCDRIEVIRIHNSESLIKDYEEIKRLALYEGNRMKMMSIFYGMLHKLSSENESSELLPALKYIYNNFHLPELTNALLAEKCGFSEVYFRKLFVKQMGLSPRQFIIDIRIQKAKQLLSEGALKIWAVSEACGFSSSYHFCRIFKERAGMTPSEYRELNRTVEF